VLVGGLIIGLIVGLLAGGHPSRLLDIRFRSAALLFGAVILRYGTELALRQEVPAAVALRLPLFALAFLLLLGGLWRNRSQPGLPVVGAGVAMNAAVVVANGGWMPVWSQSLEFAGLTPADLVPQFHRLIPGLPDTASLVHLGFLGDVLPLPLPIVPNVASVGDLIMAIGLGWFMLATLLRGTDLIRVPATAADGQPPRLLGIHTVPLQRPPASALSQTGVGPQTGFSHATGTLGGGVRPRTVAFEGRSWLGSVTGASAGSIPGSGLDLAALGGAMDLGPAYPSQVPTVLARVTEHPYVRLALDARFSAFWIGQTVSLFGDRLNQVALAVLVFGATDSPLATSLVFLTASAPYLFLGPIAGPLVDRWDQKTVLVVSDLLRAALVLLLPVAAAVQLWLVFPAVFLVTVVSAFFRPAKAAVIPRLVRGEDLMAANSATWIGETVADIAGYPLAGLFVAFLGAELPLAFWADAATYVISAILIAGLLIPPVIRAAGPAVGSMLSRFRADLVEGLRFLRGQPALFQNTMVSTVAQMSIGALLALTVVYAKDVLDGTLVAYPANYTAVEAAIGVGNLIGGVAVGVVGAHLRKGWLIGLGLLVMGLAQAFMGLTSHVYLAVALAGILGIANLVFIIPTQTLFAELTPMPLMGRVIATRSSLVLGAMTLAMGGAGVIAQVAPVGVVISAFGVLTMVMGLLALTLPAMREA
jgi:MFS family permease